MSLAKIEALERKFKVKLGAVEATRYEIGWLDEQPFVVLIEDINGVRLERGPDDAVD